MNEYRELPGKHVKIYPGEYIVYHVWAKTFIRCTPNGDALNGFNEVGYVFNDLSSAQTYCQSKVNETPKLGCIIYDHRWQIVDQSINAGYQQQLARANSPKRRLVRGILFLITGSALVWLDASHNWMLIVGFLVGARLAVGGVVHIALAIANWKTIPPEEQSPDRPASPAAPERTPP